MVNHETCPTTHKGMELTLLPRKRPEGPPNRLTNFCTMHPWWPNILGTRFFSYGGICGANTL